MIKAYKENRPLSPHLQIYKIQITSFLSILHRGTGIILYGGAFLWVIWVVALATGPENYTKIQAFLIHPFGLFILMGWSFSFFYHLCNGIRHLFWDLGVGYDMPTVRRTGWIVVISSIFLTGVSWTLGILAGEIFS